VAGEKNGLALFAQILNQFSYFYNAEGSSPLVGFVQYEQLRVVKQREAMPAAASCE
jgi:hypothetical protein